MFYYRRDELRSSAPLASQVLRPDVAGFHPRAAIIEVLLLSIYNLSMRFGARILFDDATCTFLAGRRYAITGPERRRQIDADEDPDRRD